jgi:hypothetical protein
MTIKYYVCKYILAVVFIYLHSVFNNEPSFLPFQIFTYWKSNRVYGCIVLSKYVLYSLTRSKIYTFESSDSLYSFLSFQVSRSYRGTSRSITLQAVKSSPPSSLALLFRSLHLLLETRYPAGSCRNTSQESGPSRAFRQPELYSFAVLKDPFC